MVLLFLGYIQSGIHIDAPNLMIRAERVAQLRKVTESQPGVQTA
jgi:hypothetical protein